MHSPATIDARVAEFRLRCRAAGLALTHQREVVYRAVLKSRNHPSPESIYEEVRRQIPSISLGTVYKSIKTFVDTGLIREVSLHHGTLRLEANLNAHHHLVCTRCKAIVDIDKDDVAPIEWKRRPPQGYRVERYSLEFHGLCPACAGS